MESMERAVKRDENSNAIIINHNIEPEKEEMKRALRALFDANEDEKKRLSRELHDEVGQALTSILLRIKTMQKETDLDVIYDRLNGLRYLTSQTLEEVRRLSMNLRPSMLESMGLAAAITCYLENFQQAADLELNFNITDKELRLSAEAEIVFYRALQESLTNIAKHASAKRVDVKLDCNNDHTFMIVRDDGVGMQAQTPKPRGVGLLGLQERVKLLDGTFRLTSQEGKGVTVVIVLPCVGRGQDG